MQVYLRFYFVLKDDLRDFKRGLRHVKANFGGVKCTNFPKCAHRLITNLRMAKSEKNMGRLFFSCPVEGPNTPCAFFQWVDRPLKSEYVAFQTKDDDETDGVESSGSEAGPSTRRAPTGNADDDDDGVPHSAASKKRKVRTDRSKGKKKARFVMEEAGEDEGDSEALSSE